MVLGAGAWGTAVALHAQRHPAGHEVVLWGRNPEKMQAMQAARENIPYLPGIPLPPELHLRSSSLQELAAQAPAADLLIVATPVAGLRDMLSSLRAVDVPLAWLCKGFEPAQEGAAEFSGLMPHEVQKQVAPDLRAGVLTGPSFAQEVAHGQPTALLAASLHADVNELLVHALHSQSMRIYTSTDRVAAEVGGAVKNVLAIATGLADGLDLGLNARAALITRGLAEMARLGRALGGRVESFMGLAGMGDLVLTATGDLSRNRRVGLQLAEGKSLEQAVQSLGHVAEGVRCAHVVVARARHLGVEMPIAAAVVSLLEGRLKPVEAVAALMGRDPKGELL